MTTTTHPIDLSRFIGPEQRRALRGFCRGEEGDYFRTMLKTLADSIAAMPVTYQQDGKGDEAVVHLHYFSPSSDWWITERDAGSPDDAEPGRQDQAFGFTRLNQDTENAELGYISIAELLRCRVELDLYWTPKPLGEIKERLGVR